MGNALHATLVRRHQYLDENSAEGNNLATRMKQKIDRAEPQVGGGSVFQRFPEQADMPQVRRT
ncbi:hypothetical protein MJO28_013100 [Puccinia striiformis f. sp. tritici]|uniref:Uncharacterized protein n=1 Tax=Puccinia striiformis f. sp. tritici TaxID=168172 RepID=A0ACC0DXV3_9BASI|nr:hypothetical protein MJO28_013100 [Puccinia striiformis f. sp. tritici]